MTGPPPPPAAPGGPDDADELWPAGDPRWEYEAASVAVAPPRTAPLPRPPAGRPGRGTRRVVALGAAVAALALVAATLLRTGAGTAGGAAGTAGWVARRTAGAAPAAPAAPGPPCPEGPTPAGDPPADAATDDASAPPTTDDAPTGDASAGEAPEVQVLRIEASPCPWVARYDRALGVLDLGDRGRYRLGLPADVLVVGDWDCDGAATPALYRPGDGRLFRFPAWPSGTVTASSAAERVAAGGWPRVVHRDGCDTVIIEAGPGPP